MKKKKVCFEVTRTCRWRIEAMMTKKEIEELKEQEGDTDGVYLIEGYGRSLDNPDEWEDDMIILEGVD